MVAAIGGNPIAKARAAEALSENAQREVSMLQTQLSNEPDDSSLKGLLKTKLAIAAHLVSLAKIFFEEAIQQQKADQESTKATIQLANAAR